MSYTRVNNDQLNIAYVHIPLQYETTDHDIIKVKAYQVLISIMANA